jgi:RND family efflux transporter MFP subunit
VNHRYQRGRVGLIAIIVVSLTIIAGLWYFKPQPAKRPPVKPSIPIVDSVLVQPQSYQVSVSTQGAIVPKRQISLMAEVSGQVVNISEHFVSGGFFKSDDVLIKLDDRDYRYALLSAESQVASAERELALEKGQARQAKRVWRDLGSAEANSLSLRVPQVNAARAALKAAKAEQKRGSLNIQRTSITLPFDGRVELAQVNLGQFVPAGSTLGTVFDSSVVEVRLPLSNEQIALVGIIPGANDASSIDTIFGTMPVELSATIGGKRYRWSARLTRVEASVDSRTRLFHVIAEVTQPFDTSIHEHPLVVGLFVEASISGRTIANTISIPKKAIINEQVFIVNSENKVELRPFTVIDRKGDVVWIQLDFESNEQIVISDPRVLKEGITVEIKNSQSEAEDLSVKQKDVQQTPASKE